MSSAGKEFVGPYRLFYLIRAGAMFEIWAVKPIGKDEPFAMKWLPPGAKHTRQNSAELKHEYTVGKTLDHPSVIKTLDFGTGKDGTFLIDGVVQNSQPQAADSRWSRTTPLETRRDT